MLPNVAANIWIWIGFSVFLLIALSLDAFVLNKKIAHPYQSMRAALYWTLVWIACAFIFNGLMWFYLYETTNPLYANKKALDFLTGYVIEKSLSIDNLFTFYVIFHQFKIPLRSQQRVFTYGIYTAVILRLILILLGVWLIERFHFVLYLMGLFLLVTGIKMFFVREESATKKTLQESRIFQFLQRHLRITHELHEQHFFIIKNNLIYATPLLIALIFIELSDVAFAFDSIPAIFAITRDPFIVWTSNIFAILGLRALYFFVSNMVRTFYLLKYAIALILVFVGCKIIFEPWLSVPVWLSLGIIAVILLAFTLLSVFFTRRKHKRDNV